LNLIGLLEATKTTGLPQGRAVYKNLVHSPKSLRIGTALDGRHIMRLLQPLFALFAMTDDRELAKVVE